ncbi:DEAD/DEAH box helicase [Pedobacter psychrotolerans]|uniref:DEAD/DEAH box helicase n=1 Tax=Pedobacter psychrotolerans TaxID=1843235 RepID=UPI003F947CC5
MKLDNLLTRFDEEVIQSLLGYEVISTLTLLGQNTLYSENLLKVLSNTYSNLDLLTNKASRDFIVDVLNTDEINELAKHLSYSPKTNIYEEIKHLSFRNEVLKDFCAFFEEELVSEEVKEWAAETVLSSGYPLYSYQKKVLSRVQQFLNSDKNRVLLHMPTGSGKTRTAISYICRYLFFNENKNVVWFANTKELLDQAYSEFIKAWSFLGDREIKAYKFWDKSDINLTEIKNSFIVAGLDKTYQSLMKDAGSMSAFANNCSLVIMDEAHMSIAPTYELLLENMIVNKAGLIGLSATPGRTWNDPDEDRKLAAFFFYQKAKLEIEGYDNPVDYLTKNGYLAKIKNTKLFSNSGISLSQADYNYLAAHYVLPMSKLIEISENKLRNMAIASKINELVKSHQRIIFFAITKNHAIVLNSILTALGIKSKVVTSETSTVERSKVIGGFKISRKIDPEPMVLCNYGILTTGFDAPETSCAVIARPTDSLVLYSQMVGRAIRGIRSGGNEIAEIVTVIDENLPGFNDVADAFINWEDVWQK